MRHAHLLPVYRLKGLSMPQVEAIRQEVDELLPGLVADRRYLHEHPELSFQEFETAAFVAERLQQLGVEDIRTGIGITGGTGLIHGTKPGPGKTVLVRADMDALPIPEENKVDYVSQNDGVMHACGHDAHTAILLGLARYLSDHKGAFSGTVKLLFQPAEELPPGGAQAMIKEGVLEDPDVDAVFGLHMANGEQVGLILVGAGALMAAADGFTITVHGRGGHGAHPHGSVDPIVIGAQIVVALQTVVSRNTDPMDAAVVTTGMFQSGHAPNVIPETATLRGTVRTFKPETRDLMEERITAIATDIAEALGGSATVDYARGYPATVNDEALTALVRGAATEVVGAENVVERPPAMGAEDFSYFLEQKPGSYFFVGSKNDEKGFVWPHHHPRFDIDEESLSYGLATMANVVLTYLDQA